MWHIIAKKPLLRSDQQIAEFADDDDDDKTMVLFMPFIVTDHRCCSLLSLLQSLQFHYNMSDL